MSCVPSMQLTVVRVTDYAALYKNGKLVGQDHSIELHQLEAIAAGAPFYFVILDADGTAVDDLVYEHGQFPSDKPLHKIVAMMDGNK